MANEIKPEASRMFDKLKDAKRILIAPVTGPRPCQVPDCERNGTVHDGYHFDNRGVYIPRPVASEGSAQDNARLFGNLKSDNLQAMADHFAGRSEALADELAQVKAERDELEKENDELTTLANNNMMLLDKVQERVKELEAASRGG